MQIDLRITSNCDLTCGHCYIGAGAGKETMKRAAIDTTIDHLPDGLDALAIVGGEVFTVKPTLEHALDRIAQQRSRLLLPKGLLVQTHGKWIRDADAALPILRMLAGYGVNNLDIASNDRHHVNAGLKSDRFVAHEDAQKRMVVRMPVLDDALRALSDEGVQHSMTYQVHGENSFLPLGRGASLLGAVEHFRCQISREQDYFRIVPGGEVYPCCWEQSLPLGSILKEPLIDILARASANPVYEILAKGRVRSVARSLGGHAAIISTVDCVTCAGIFNEHRSKYITDLKLSHRQQIY